MTTSTGTLLWIGERDSLEFGPIFQYCEQHAAQLAYRCDVDDALWRPADNVQVIVVAQADRANIETRDYDLLMSRYDCSNRWHVLGPLCAGQRGCGDESNRIYWHQWNQFAEQVVADCGLPVQRKPGRPKSLIVVAESIMAAEPLLDLAASCSTAAVWCRSPKSVLTSNFDVIWWDDSVATPASEQDWRDRIQLFQHRTDRPQTHVWVTNTAPIQAMHAAQRAGIDLVLTKPLRIEPLLATIDPVSINEAEFEEPFEPIIRAA